MDPLGLQSVTFVESHISDGGFLGLDTRVMSTGGRGKMKIYKWPQLQHSITTGQDKRLVLKTSMLFVRCLFVLWTARARSHAGPVTTSNHPPNVVRWQWAPTPHWSCSERRVGREGNELFWAFTICQHWARPAAAKDMVSGSALSAHI